MGTRKREPGDGCTDADISKTKLLVCGFHIYAVCSSVWFVCLQLCGHSTRCNVFLCFVIGLLVVLVTRNPEMKGDWCSGPYYWSEIVRCTWWSDDCKVGWRMIVVSGLTGVIQAWKGWHIEIYFMWWSPCLRYRGKRITESKVGKTYHKPNLCIFWMLICLFKCKGFICRDLHGNGEWFRCKPSPRLCISRDQRGGSVEHNHHAFFLFLSRDNFVYGETGMLVYCFAMRNYKIKCTVPGFRDSWMLLYSNCICVAMRELWIFHSVCIQ